MLEVAAGLMRCRSRASPVGERWGGLLMSVLIFGSPFPVTLVGVSVTGVMMLMGAGSAAGSLALTRRADDRELLEHSADVADIGLTEEEKRELLAG